LPKVAYIGMGSNMGARRQHLSRARRLLASSPGVKLLRVSSLYETEPISPVPQRKYLNAVAEIETGLTASRLLALLLSVESTVGRRRGEIWGPRIIDLDLLLLAQDVIYTEGLTVPHPGLSTRAFVLTPLLELAPGLRDPATGLPLALYFERVGGQGVRRIEGARW